MRIIGIFVVLALLGCDQGNKENPKAAPGPIHEAEIEVEGPGFVPDFDVKKAIFPPVGKVTFFQKVSQPWKGFAIEQHPETGKPACVITSTLVAENGDPVSVQVYAQFDGDQYLEPTVFVSSVKSKTVFNVEVVSREKNFLLRNVEFSSSSDSRQVAIVALDEREALIETMANGSASQVRLLYGDREISKSQIAEGLDEAFEALKTTCYK